MAIVRGDYGEGIRRIAGGRFEPGVLEVRPDTPDALIALGLPNLPMHHTTAHAAAEMAPERANGHGVDPAVLLSLPELLEHPVAAVESGSRDGVIAVVLDAVAGNLDDPLTAMIDPGHRLDAGAETSWRPTSSSRSTEGATSCERCRTPCPRERRCCTTAQDSGRSSRDARGLGRSATPREANRTPIAGRLTRGKMGTDGPRWAPSAADPATESL